MSISTTPIRAADGSQFGQKIAPPVATNRAQGTPLTARAVTAAADTSKVLATQASADAKADDAVKLSAAQTQQSLQEINKVMDALSISVQFQMDPDLNQTVIKVVDQQSGKVIRQFPSEDALRISKALDNLKGVLFAKAV
jgi:flagellar protein FlaG